MNVCWFHLLNSSSERVGFHVKGIVSAGKFTLLRWKQKYQAIYFDDDSAWAGLVRDIHCNNRRLEVLIKWVNKCRLGVDTSSLPVHVFRIWMTLQEDSFYLAAPPGAHGVVCFPSPLLMNKPGQCVTPAGVSQNLPKRNEGEIRVCAACARNENFVLCYHTQGKTLCKTGSFILRHVWTRSLLHANTACLYVSACACVHR